jgi:alpha-galactosidase
MKLIGSQRVRDLWRQKDMGVYASRYSAVVSSHGVVLVKVEPVKM